MWEELAYRLVECKATNRSIIELNLTRKDTCLKLVMFIIESDNIFNTRPRLQDNTVLHYYKVIILTWSDSMRHTT